MSRTTAALAAAWIAGACVPAPLREDHASMGLGFGVLLLEDVNFAGSVPGVNDAEDIRVSGGGLTLERYLTPEWAIAGGIDLRVYQPRDVHYTDAEAAEFTFRVRRAFWTDRELQPFIGLRVFTALEWHLESGEDTSPYLGVAPAVGFTYFQSAASSFEFAFSWVRTLKAPVIDGVFGQSEEVALDFEGPELTWWLNYWF